MKLSAISYCEYPKDVREWKLDKLVFGSSNLLVGKNATGKTRTLRIIKVLSNLLSGQKKDLVNGRWDAEFVQEDVRFHYTLNIKDQQVLSEKLLRVRAGRKKMLLQRRKNGSGQLWAEKSKRSVDFQSPQDQIVAVARRDKIQHSYFIPLVDWGKAVFFFPFGRELGAQTLLLKVEDPAQKQLFDPKDTSMVVDIFQRGEKEFGNKFVTDVVSDMQQIGYLVDKIEVDTPTGVIVSRPIPGKLLSLNVKEKDLRCITEQMYISAGMFAALSVIVQINYLIRSLSPSCFIIDDIGEGLDYERSCAIIDVLIDKASKYSIQLIMSSNDRFVMNRVPLQMWTILNRKGSVVKGFNIHNSAKKFEQFRFTGMSNFDLFATNYLFSNSRK